MGILRNMLSGTSAVEQATGAIKEYFQKSIPQAEEIAKATLTSEDALTHALDNLRTTVNKLIDMLNSSPFFGNNATTETQTQDAALQAKIDNHTATAGDQKKLEESRWEQSDQADKLSFWADLLTGKFGAAGKDFTGLMTKGYGPTYSQGAAAAVNGTAQSQAAPASSGGTAPQTVINQNNFNTEHVTTTPIVQQPTSRAPGESK
jgi:hypothetical protein